jgi:hypothetical protein
MDFPQTIPISNVESMDDDDKWLAQESFQAAKWLSEFSWVRRLESAVLVYGIPGILVVCDMKILPISKGVDKALWVISGDIPSLYLVKDDAENYEEAISLYCEVIQHSLECFYKKSAEDCYPVDGLNGSTAGMLQSRISFIRDRILPKM